MNRRVVIVGGGTSTATKLQRLGEDIEIAVLERSEGVSYASCGLPFHIDGTIPEDDLAIVAPLLAGNALGAQIGAAATSIVDEDDDVREHEERLTNTRVVQKGLLVNYDQHEVEPPHPVCEMKSGKRRERVVGKRERETPEIHDITEERTQR